MSWFATKDAKKETTAVPEQRLYDKRGYRPLAYLDEVQALEERIKILESDPGDECNCAYCRGNGGDAPCCYPGENRPGCLGCKPLPEFIKKILDKPKKKEHNK